MDSIVPHQQPHRQPPSQPWQPPVKPEHVMEPVQEPVEEFDEIVPAQQYQAPVIKEPIVETPSFDPAQAYFNDAQNSAPAVEEIHFVDTTPDEEPLPLVAEPVFDAPISYDQPVVANVESDEEMPVTEVPAVEAPTEKVSYADSSIQELEISQIVANPYQPRTQFKPEALQELADSIKEHGVIQPLVVTKTPTGYEIVVGERRFRASQLAGLTKIPAIVKSSLHDQTKLEVALIENTQRQDLNAIEEARGYERMIKEFNLTQDQVAKKVGKSRSAVANTLRLLNLPAEIQRGVIEGKITEGHARAILGLGEIEKMILMYEAIQEQGLNVRQVEAKVREITVKRRMDAATPDPKLMALETELRGKLQTQVKIQRQGRGGKITIDFFSDEDLEEIMNRIAEQKASDNNYLVV